MDDVEDLVRTDPVLVIVHQLFICITNTPQAIPSTNARMSSILQAESLQKDLNPVQYHLNICQHSKTVEESKKSSQKGVKIVRKGLPLPRVIRPENYSFEVFSKCLFAVQVMSHSDQMFQRSKVSRFAP